MTDLCSLSSSAKLEKQNSAKAGRRSAFVGGDERL
jgi:hypothetical protein